MIYSEFYNENKGKDICVELMDGKMFTGELYGYISEWDNEPDPESILVKNAIGVVIELFVEEIANIKVES